MLIALAFPGCGGGEETTQNPAPGLSGVWTGTLGRVAGDTIEIEFHQDGTNVTGTGRLTSGNQPFTGTLTGTLDANNHLTVTTTFNGQNFSYTGDLNGTTLTGTYDLGAEHGNLSLAKSPVTTANVAGAWTGSYTSTAGGGTGALSVNFTQNGNALTGNGSAVVAGQTVNGTVTGTIIGNKITYGVASGGGAQFSYTATVNGTQMSGTYSGADDTGNFTLHQ